MKKTEADFGTQSGQTQKKSRRKQRRRPGRKKIIYAFCTAVAALILVILALILQGVQKNTTADEYLASASECYNTGDYDTALTWLRRAEKLEDSEEIQLRIADCYEALGNYDRALEILRGLDITKETISARIKRITDMQESAQSDGSITICGKVLTPDATELNLDECGVSDSMLPQLSDLYSLESLSASGNGLRDISALSTLGGLTTLNLSNNSITDISALSGLAGLRTLILDNNPIEDFSPVYSLSNLMTLSICGCDISAEKLQELSSALPKCAIYYDQETENSDEITLGGISFSKNVQELNLSGLGISDITALASCKELRKLNLSQNEISDLSVLTEIPNLVWLDISDNSIVNLNPLLSLTEMTYLNAASNFVESTATLGNLVHLKELNLNNNPITVFTGLSRMSEIETLRLSGTGLTENVLSDLEVLKTLKLLEISDNDDLSGEAVDELIESLPGCTVTHSELTYRITLGGVSYPETAEEVDLSGLGLTDITEAGKFGKAETIDLSGNAISDIAPLQNCKRVTYLDLSGNQITDLTALASLDKLEYLELSGNSIESVEPLLGLTKLEVLNVSGNGLSAEQIQLLLDALPDCSVIY